MVQSAALAVGRARARTWTFARWLEAVPVWQVLAAFVVLQWTLVLGIAFVVRHNGWIYYQGGDQLWYYTTSWLLGHGHFPQPGVGYLWPIVMLPVALVTGPNVADAYPAIVVIQFLFFLPIAPLALYGIGRRLGGRLFGYWTVAVWLAVPLIGIWYTDAGYHQRFTEVLLPQGFGLTAMADSPTMLATLVSAYFCVRALVDDHDVTFAALCAGAAAGAAFAIKPATALFLAGPVLAFVVARRWRAAAAFAAAMLPAVVALAFIKWRGFGYLPILHADGAARVAAGASGSFVAGGVKDYIPFDWHTFTSQLDQVREHFWSVRLVEWLVIAGAIGIVLRSRRIGALVVGWFAAIVIIKTGSGRGGMEGGNLLRLLMPAYPAFVLMLASLPFLWPGLARRRPTSTEPPRAVPRRAQLSLLIAGLLAVAIVPIAAYAAASPIQQGDSLRAAYLESPPIPIDVDLGLHIASRSPLTIAWRPQTASGGQLFYHVFIRPPKTPRCVRITGTRPAGAYKCTLALQDLGTTRMARFTVARPPRGTSEYVVGVAANWINDTNEGDVYLVGRPIRVTSR